MISCSAPLEQTACPISQLRPKTVSWLWPGRLARGKLAILDGDPNLGKSVVTLDLCARLSTGRPWPDGSPNPAAECALVLNGEDDDEDTTRPRLDRLGADGDRVFVLHRAESDFGPPLSLPGRTDALARALEQTHARLVIVDPLLGFLGQDVNPWCDPSVRRALSPLAELARRYECAMLLIRHLNKQVGRRALYRGLGSIGLVGLCRSAWLIAADLAVPGRRVFAQVKNNLAPPQPSLAFELTGPEREPPSLHWLGPVDVSADTLLAEGTVGSTERPRRDLAREFLLTALDDGPRTTRELWHAGQAEGLSERTLRRAKDELDIRLVQARVDGKRTWYWLLPEQELPPGAVGDVIDPELREALRQMNQLYPPTTPLDDV